MSLSTRIAKAVKVIHEGKIRQLPNQACPKCNGGKFYDGPSEMCGCWIPVDSRSTSEPCERHQCPWCKGTGTALTYQVDGTGGTRTVRILPSGFFLCTCPWGDREWLGNACYHAIAACGMADVDIPLEPEEVKE